MYYITPVLSAPENLAGNRLSANKKAQASVCVVLSARKCKYWVRLCSFVARVGLGWSNNIN